jgi:hypothetical protein
MTSQQMCDGACVVFCGLNFELLFAVYLFCDFGCDQNRLPFPDACWRYVFAYGGFHVPMRWCFVLNILGEVCVGRAGALLNGGLLYILRAWPFKIKTFKGRLAWIRQ